jgi:YegS/Rv2252/BmrU family lipid kinase
MPFKNIHFLINPASGKNEPILSFLHKALCDTDINWEVIIPKNERDVIEKAQSLAGKTDLVVIYGGDGSVTHVARALQHTDTPMAIIPGGTANVLSKELGIPQDSEEAIALIVSGDTKVISMDTGEANGTAFLLRINLGIMADMILEADRGLKNTFGQVAYGISAIKTIASAENLHFKLTIDGKQIEEDGVSLTVTNTGSIGIGDMALLPGISISDGFFDVILLHDASLLSVLQVAGSTLFQQESDVLKHWQCKQIVIETDHPVKYICDDCEEQADRIDIKINPMALKVLVPAHKE